MFNRHATYVAVPGSLSWVAKVNGGKISMAGKSWQAVMRETVS
jgi:hypothetical protein